MPSVSHSHFETIVSSARKAAATKLVAGKFNPIPDKPGDLQWIDKHKIQIDHDYQRENVKQRLVNKIAENFAWSKFSVIMVGRRPDGSLFAYDGQHRALSALLRPDVDKIPCMIYDTDEIDIEADAFLGINEDRSQVSAIDKHRAALKAGDKLAVKLQALIDHAGLELSDTRNKGTIQCIRALRNAGTRDFERLARIFPIIVEISDGEPIHERLVLGLHEISMREGGEDLFKPAILNKIKLLRAKGLLVAGAEAAAYYAKGGARVWAAGFKKAINSGKRTQKLEVELGEAG